MQTKIYCPDLECESCVKVLTKALHELGIENPRFMHDAIELDFNPEHVGLSTITTAIQNRGYRAGLDPFVRKTFSERFRDFFQNKHKYAIERKMFSYAAIALGLLLFTQAFAYMAFLHKIPGFIEKFAWWIFYVDVAIVSIGSAVWHFKSYKAEVTSMVGMMIGMTFGMQTGMILGTIFGATNGLFVGGTTGMVVAVGIGFYNGKCCGIMGVLEGMMAGVMGGVMGSMIGTMFRVDNILWFMPVFMFINLLIMWGLSYMLFEEMVEGKTKIVRAPIDFSTFFSYCLVAVAILGTLMIYGPKTGLASALGGVV